MTVENLRLPVGRIVAGNPTKFDPDVDFYTKQPKLDKNGLPKKICWFNVAIPKDKFMAEVWPHMAQEASLTLPSATQIHPDNYESQKFAFKVINGDSSSCPQGSNVPYNAREGYKGCYIIRFSSSAFAPGCFKYENGAYRRLNENEIKTGDFIVVNTNITAHKEKDGGLYWNPNGVELVGYGTEITGGGAPDPTAMFGGATYQLPPGASATPLSSAPIGSQMPTVAPAPAPMPAPAPAPVAAPAPMPAPAFDFVQNAGIPFASAGAQQPSAPQTANGFAAPATSFPIR